MNQTLAQTAGWSTPDVLVIDDDEDDRLLMRYALSQAMPDVRIMCLPDAAEALTYMGQCARPPALVITDLNMPCMTGLELLQRIRRSATNASVPVVVLTTSQSPEDRQRCYQAGANAFLNKPVSLNDLADLIRSCIRIWSGTV